MTDNRQGYEKKDLRQVDRRNLIFYLRVFDGMSHKILGHAVNISEKGVMLICDDPVEVDKDFRLRMHLPSLMKDTDEIIFSATSKWYKKDADPKFYLAGFQIEKLEPVNEKVIDNLIKEFSYKAAK
ncbi:MAG: PilZ domain-containing protein [Desulforhopalus sp.]